jgi:hypothetical protein
LSDLLSDPGGTRSDNSNNEGVCCKSGVNQAGEEDEDENEEILVKIAGACQLRQL